MPEALSVTETSGDGPGVVVLRPTGVEVAAAAATPRTGAASEETHSSVVGVIVTSPTAGVVAEGSFVPYGLYNWQ